jgi:hypothetical protein
MASRSDCGAKVTSRGGPVMTVRHVAGRRPRGTGSFAEGALADLFRDVWPASPSPSQPAFVKVGMNRYPGPGTVAMNRGWW